MQIWQWLVASLTFLSPRLTAEQLREIMHALKFTCFTYWIRSWTQKWWYGCKCKHLVGCLWNLLTMFSLIIHCFLKLHYTFSQFHFLNLFSYKVKFWNLIVLSTEIFRHYFKLLIHIWYLEQHIRGQEVWIVSLRLVLRGQEKWAVWILILSTSFQCQIS